MNFTAKICTFLMCVCLGLCMNVATVTAGVVSYDGNSQEFIFAPGSKESPTNLFANLQSVMPGDSLTEQIVIKNSSSNHMDVEVYLRSKGAQEGTDFLSQLKLTVKQADNSVLFEAPANEAAQLSDWVHLGTVYAGGEITLDVTLEVPITMGNEYQKSSGYIDWEFRIDEVPEEEEDDTSPIPQPDEPVLEPTGTGDNSHIGRYIVLLLACGVLFFKHTKKQNGETK